MLKTPASSVTFYVRVAVPVPCATVVVSAAKAEPAPMEVQPKMKAAMAARPKRALKFMPTTLPAPLSSSAGNVMGQ